MKHLQKVVGILKMNLQVEIVPGVSALNSCASIVGSPLMTDFAVVSMSDLLGSMGNY